MRPLSFAQALVVALVTSWAASGCASRPVSQQSQAGHVDFVIPAGDPVWPEIHVWDPKQNQFKRLYAKLRDPAGGVVRLAAAPGEHRYKVYILNEATTGPAIITNIVVANKVSPVFLHLTPAGDTLFERRERQTGANYRGNYGRTIRYSAEQTTLLDLKLVPGEPWPGSEQGFHQYKTQTP